MNAATPTAGISELAGHAFPPSEWLEITQDRVNLFAEATGDHQFIHVDPARAAATPFGGTVAHGFLTLSLIPALTGPNLAGVEGLVMAINYGSDQVRFLQPVRVGSRIRARQEILEAAEKRPGQWLLKSRVTVEIENGERPALVADTLALLIVH